jgi:hypothetical protein
VHPLPQRDSSNQCPLPKRVLAQAYREDDPEDNDDSYLDGYLRLTPRLSHRVTGPTGSERPAPVPEPGTGRYRPVISFVLVPHTGRAYRPGLAAA